MQILILSPVTTMAMVLYAPMWLVVILLGARPVYSSGSRILPLLSVLSSEFWMDPGEPRSENALHSRTLPLIISTHRSTVHAAGLDGGLGQDPLGFFVMVRTGYRFVRLRLGQTCIRL